LSNADVESQWEEIEEDEPPIQPPPPALTAAQVEEIASRVAAQFVANNPLTVLEAIRAAMELAVDASRIPRGRYSIVVAPDYEEAYYRTFDSFDEVLEEFRRVRREGGQAFGCHSEVFLPSKGGDYLVTPWGRFPLFVAEASDEVDPRGRLGPARPRPQPQPAAPQDNTSDDFEEDGSEDEDGLEDEDI
jgi:hypothetical protein